MKRLAVLVMLVLASAGVSLFLGAADLSPSQVVRSLAEDTGEGASLMIREVRLPRIVLAAVVGAALSISGALLQAFFQNPMAGPYVAGVSSGAGLAAVAAITLGLRWRIGPVDSVAIAGFAGGLAAVALVYALARRIRSLQAEGLLLIGIAVGAVFSALTSMLLIFGGQGTHAALFWMLGTFAGANWSITWVAGSVLVAAGACAVLFSRDLNLLLWGEEVALSLGSPVPRVRIWILVLSSLLAAASVAACGVIGFVGLMVPHIARGWMRSVDHRFVLPASALIGAVLVMAADGLARTAYAPVELPVGAITSALGAPFLVVLVVRRRRRFGG